MKKIVVMLVTMMFVAGSAMAMETISDGQMDQITGQAGVSIAVDDVKLFQEINGLTYTDTDGLTDPLGLGKPTGGPAGISIDNLRMMVTIDAITQDKAASGAPAELYSPGRSLGFNTAGSTYNGYNWYNTDTPAGDDTLFVPSAITIDVTDKLPILSEALAYKATALSTHPVVGSLSGNDVQVAGVQIGLPTVAIQHTALTFDIAVADANSINSGSALNVSGTPYADNSYGQISIGSQKIVVLDGTLEIAPH